MKKFQSRGKHVMRRSVIACNWASFYIAFKLKQFQPIMLLEVVRAIRNNILSSRVVNWNRANDSFSRQTKCWTSKYSQIRCYDRWSVYSKKFRIELLNLHICEFKKLRQNFFHYIIDVDDIDRGTKLKNIRMFSVLFVYKRSCLIVYYQCLYCLLYRVCQSGL